MLYDKPFKEYDEQNAHFVRADKMTEMPINTYFVDANKIVHLGVAGREIQDIVSSRYACYLVIIRYY